MSHRNVYIITDTKNKRVDNCLQRTNSYHSDCGLTCSLAISSSKSNCEVTSQGGGSRGDGNTDGSTFSLFYNRITILRIKDQRSHCRTKIRSSQLERMSCELLLKHSSHRYLRRKWWYSLVYQLWERSPWLLVDVRKKHFWFGYRTTRNFRGSSNKHIFHRENVYRLLVPKFHFVCKVPLLKHFLSTRT